MTHPQVFPAALHRIGPTGAFGLLALVSLAQALFTWTAAAASS